MFPLPILPEILVLFFGWAFFAAPLPAFLNAACPGCLLPVGKDQSSIKLATPAKLPSECRIYLLKESDFHLPCCMICSTEAPFCAKAVVPPILKECPLMFP